MLVGACADVVVAVAAEGKAVSCVPYLLGGSSY